VYIAYSQSNKDTNSYVKLIKWSWNLNDTALIIDDDTLLKSWDNIRVIGDNSLAVIQWWDGSMTRLWWNTKISIEQSEISKDFTNIDISFELIAGKTWSNIVSFIWSDSSFTQNFNDIEAWVRGTIFDVDLEKKFIHVSDHSVQLTSSDWEVIIVPEWRAVNLQTFSLVDISKYVSELEDKAWKEINQSLDSEYIENLKSSIQSSNPFLYLLRFISPKYAILYVLDSYENQRDIDAYIASMSQDKKEAVYNNVLSEYQKINFVSPQSEEYARKIRYKKALISLNIDNNNSDRLITRTWYDLQDILQTWSDAWLQQTITLLRDNIDRLSSQEISLIRWDINSIPKWLLDEFSNSFDDLWEILNVDFSKLGNVNDLDIWSTLDAADGAIKNFLDENVGWFLEKFSD